MPDAVILQAQDDCPPALLGEWAQRRGIEVHVVRVDRGEPFPDPRDPDFAIALGATATATGGGPDWVAHEIEWLRAADAADLPVLGICLGAQVLAAALGGRVHRLPAPEIGWVTVDTADADRVPAGPWLAWHEDGFTLPPLAYELASNEFGVQAFVHRRHLGVQFHPEVTAEVVGHWVGKGGRERIDPADTRRHAPVAARAADALFDGFTARAGMVAVASRG